MPRIDGVEKVLVVGSGGIVIGQAAEFDYSGSQALKALEEENIETVLVNPNVATIQTSHRMADKVYLEPCTPEFVAQIIKREKPDGILLGFGGQTALNVGVQLSRQGVLESEGVKVLGTGIDVIEKTEDRGLFKEAMMKLGVEAPLSDVAYDVKDALRIAKDINYPVIVRVAYTLGGGGSGIAKKADQLTEISERALNESLEHQVLVEQYLENWKEIEYEVMRDNADNTITVAALENFDPLGIHTGDSIVVAPTQTLTNREYQILRDAAIRVINGLRIIGECNIQFGLDPKSERYVAIEVNARLSRSSALASKATGYPLAYISAKCALGYLLPELKNKVTGVTTACFEPALDYVIVKIPRWDFRKFLGADCTIGPQMKSVGEVMGIGRCFEEALQKAIRELEIGKLGLVLNPGDKEIADFLKLREQLSKPTHERLFKITKAIEMEMPIEEIYRLTGVDPWFLYKIKGIAQTKKDLLAAIYSDASEKSLQAIIDQAKRLGFSDTQIASALRKPESEIRDIRRMGSITPKVKMIDTMAAEWPSRTSYCYMTYGGDEDDLEFNEAGSKLVVLGAGCIRIGSSVEFDYCTMNTVWAMKEEGVAQVIVVNNNPETVSTDYDMSDKLYFEEMTLERVLDIVDKEKPQGLVVSVGGQTPNNLAIPLANSGVKILGTSASNIDRAEDRAKFSAILKELGITQAEWKALASLDEMKSFCNRIGYPVIVRPSYVLSGAAMRVANDEAELVDHITQAAEVSKDHPVVISKFIQGAKEVEIDAAADGEAFVIGAIIEHIEFAGTHSGDANMVTPPQSLETKVIETIEEIVGKIVQALEIKGPFNIQFLVKNGDVYVIELNLRASRSIPFSSKSSGVPVVSVGAKTMLGRKLGDLNIRRRTMYHVAVKSPTFSFSRIKGADPIIGVEMTSTGEVACLDYDYPSALFKALKASGLRMPTPGKYVLITVPDEEKARATELARRISKMDYRIVATRGTAEHLSAKGVENVQSICKVAESNHSLINLISRGEIGLVINVPSQADRTSIKDGFLIRRTASEFLVPVFTRMETAEAIVDALEKARSLIMPIRPLDEYLPRSSSQLV